MRRPNRLLVRFLATYLSVIGILSVFSIALFNLSVGIIEENIVTTNRTILDQAMRVIEGRFHETSLLLFQLVVSQNVKDFVYSTRSDETHIQVARRVQSDLKNVLSVNSFLDGLFVFSTHNNMVLSHNAYYDVKTFFSRYAEHSRVGYSEWYLSILPWSHFGRYLPAAPVRLFDTEDEYLAVVWSIPIGIRGQYDGAFIYFVKTSKILDILNAGGQPGGKLSAIVDADGNTLVGATLRDSPERSRERYVETAIVSEKTGWTYVSAVPYASLMAPALEFRTLSWAIIGIMVLLGAAVSFFMAHLNADPIDAIIRVLRELRPKEQSRSGQFAYLRTSVSELIEQNNQLSIALDESVPLIRRSFFERLLYGRLADRDQLDALRAKIAMDANGELFATLIVRHAPDERSDIAQSGVGFASVTDRLMEGVSSAFDRLLWVSECEAGTLAVVAWPSASVDDFRRYLADCAEMLLESLEPLSGGFWIAFGRVYGDLLDARLSFQEARKAIVWVGCKPRSSVVWYDEITSHESSNPYTLLFEQRLIDQVLAGDKHSVVELIDRLYKELVVQQPLSAPFLQVLEHEIIGTITRILQETQQTDMIDATLRSINCEGSIDEFFADVRAQFADLCDTVRERRVSDEAFFRRKIVEIIKKHHAEPEFTVNSLSDLVGISPASLNRYFNLYVGLSFAKYLEHARIETAQALLENTDKPIGVIALETGYSSDKSFRRAFRRITGASPRIYRTGASFEEADRTG